MPRRRARFGRIPLAELVGPAAALARDGVALNEQQAYVVEILGDIVTRHAGGRGAVRAGGAAAARRATTIRQPELADALERLGAEGAEPFYTGDIAAAIVEWVAARGGMLTAEDLAAYRVIDRAPVRAAYRGRDVADQPAAVGRRDPDRAGAGAARRRAGRRRTTSASSR